MWMGGWAPLGDDIVDRKLIINEPEAALVKLMFERFLKCGSATALAQELAQEGRVGKRGKPLDKGVIYKLLNNPVYVGEAVHKGTSYPGEHQAIVSRRVWDKVRAVLAEAPRHRAGEARNATPALLKGLIFGPTGAAMSPTHTKKGNRLYRYYVSQSVLKRGREACPVGRVPAGQIEAAVVEQLRTLLRSPEIVVATWRSARQSSPDVTDVEVREALHQLDSHRDELFPAEQARIVQLLVERVEVGTEAVEIRLRTDGLHSLYGNLSPPRDQQRAA